MGTIRKAVGELEAERILVREQGRGTFVVTHNRDYMLNVFFQIVDAAGRKELPQARLLAIEKGAADATTAQRLQIAPRAPVYRIKLLQLSAADRAKLQRRFAAHQAGPSTSVPWEKVRASLFKRED